MIYCASHERRHHRWPVDSSRGLSSRRTDMCCSAYLFACYTNPVAEVPLEVAAFARYGALAEQPALRSRADAVMAGRQLRAARGPVHAHGHELFAEDHVVVLAPGDVLPAVRWQGLEDSLGR